MSERTAAGTTAPEERPGGGSRVTQATQEIRVALTMTGGVSLAIWMGGLARELNLLAQASSYRRKLSSAAPLPDPAGDETSKVRMLYLRLIDFLDVTVDIDVLSGTSAGGINSALLAYARVNDADLGSLRDLWLNVGSMLNLLRDPDDPALSLMQGDGVMLAELARCIPQLQADPLAEPSGRQGEEGEPPPTTLFVTATLLSGETSRFSDSFGTLVQDVDHHGLFRFTEADLNPHNAGALALAARCSASFPAAFEPSFVPFTDPAEGGGPAHPAMAGFSDFTRPHWTADGGLLDNQPIGPLLETVFDRPAGRLVRRVLLYVVPSAGDAPDPLRPPPPDRIDEPYNLLAGLLKELGAVAKQSIAADLQAIRDHNDQNAVRTDGRLQLAAMATRLTRATRQEEPAGYMRSPAGTLARDGLLSGGLLADYRFRQAGELAGVVVPTLLRQLATWPAAATGDPDPVPRGWQKALQPGQIVPADRACREAIITALAGDPPLEATASTDDPGMQDNPADGSPADDAAKEREPGPARADPVARTGAWGGMPGSFPQLAAFGRPGYDGAKAVALSVLRAAVPLVETPESQARLADCIRHVHNAFSAPARPDLAGLVREWCQEEAIRNLDLAAAATEITERYLRQVEGAPIHGEAPPDGAAGPLVTAWENLGAALTTPEADSVLAGLPGGAAAGAGAQRGKEQLRTYREYLQPEEGAEAVALRLFALFAAQRAMLPTDADVEQPVEFVQASADTRTSLDRERSTAARKLAGEQMHHFGAFLKESWRANDWTWGRLDGAGWLVHLLLDPRRLRALASRQQEADKVTWLIGELTAPGVTGAPPLAATEALGFPVTPAGTADQVILWEDTIRAELAFLNDPAIPVPPSVPLTAMWVARLWQQHIAADELPVLADAITAPQSDGISAAEHTVTDIEQHWAQAVTKARADGRLADQAAGLMAACPLPDETWESESTSPLMIITAAKAAATTAAAIGSVPLPGPMPEFTGAVHKTVMHIYHMIRDVYRVRSLLHRHHPADRGETQTPTEQPPVL